MLRQVFIVKDGEVLYKRNFGKGLDDDGFKQAFKQISGEAFKLAVEKTQYHDFFKYRIGYLSLPEFNLIFMFISDLSDKFANVKKELIKCRKEFIDMFGAILDEKLDSDTFEIFDPTIDLIHKNLRPKISLVGFSGVGKTTITRLITAEDIPMEHIPTITGDIGTIKIGKLHFHLWDFAGQEQFSFLWNNFIKGSDAVLLITDSTLENCEKSKYFVELIKKEAPFAHAAAIGNKQDLPDAMPIAEIERHLNMKVYSMIATDPDNRNKMITVIADVLEMSGNISPLLKPLLERDKKIKEAEKALEEGNFKEAIVIFEKLADLSLELGDDRVSQDFNEKAQKIQGILQHSEETNKKEPKAKETSDKPTISQPKRSPEIEKPPISKTSSMSPEPPKPPVSLSPPKPPKPPVSQSPPKPPKPPVSQSPPKPPKQQISQIKKPDQNLDQLGMLLKKLKSKQSAKSKNKQKFVPSALGSSSKFAKKVDLEKIGTPPIAKQDILKEKNPPAQQKIPIESKQPAGKINSNREDLITDLKIKIANVNKTLLDIEMQNILGDMSDEDFNKKNERLESVKERLGLQIKELK